MSFLFLRPPFLSLTVYHKIHTNPILPHPALPPNQPHPPPTSRTAALRKAWRGETTQCAAVREEKLRHCRSSSSRAQLFLKSHSWPAQAPSTSTPASSFPWPSASSTSSTGTSTWPRTPWRVPGTLVTFSYLCTSFWVLMYVLKALFRYPEIFKHNTGDIQFFSY